MNLRSNWCLFGFLTWVVMAGMASAQQEGSVRLGGPADGELPPPLTTFDGNAGQVNLGGSGPGNYANYDRTFRPRFNVDSRGGGLYGYQAGYTNVGLFVPYTIEDDTAILFGDARGLVTYDGKGGANVGAGWRWWMEDLDRIIGVSGWYDFDAGHTRSYDQIGLSFESLGRFVDFRTNGYMPIGKRDHVLGTTLDSSNTQFLGNGLFFNRTTVAEQTFTGFDTEVGGPMPLLGRYGVNGYLGGYHFIGNGQRGGSVTGLSTRLMAQVNEDVSVGVQLTDDNVFGTNVQAQVFVTLPEGTPSRWLRNPRVRDRLTASVFRQYRVMAHTDTFDVPVAAINPKDGLPYFVTHIDPNATAAGTGTIAKPFNSIANYNALSLAQRQQSDILYVRPRTDNTSIGLDTAGTLTLFDGQRLLSTSVQHQFAFNLNGNMLTGNLPGFVTGANLPLLFNSTGGDVVTLAANAAQCIEVSGFDITGSATGNGIHGTDNTFVLINNNNIHDALNGVLLTNLTGTVANGRAAVIVNNNIHDNIEDGFHVINTAAAPLEVVVMRNTFANNGNDGLQLDANAGSYIGGLIGAVDIPAITGPPVIPAVLRGNTFDGNGANGIHLTADNGKLDFKTITAAVDNGIANNKFYRQAGTGLLVEATNNSNLQLNIFANAFGNDPLTPTVTSGNLDDGIRINANGGITNIMIGGNVAALGNVFGGNLANGIVLNLTGASVNTLDIGFNTLALGGASGGGGNIFLTGHDVDFHTGQLGFDSVILDFLRGVGSANVIPSDQYSIAVIGSGSGNWSFSDPPLGVQVKPGYQSTTFYDTDILTTNPALWDKVFASNAIIILSHSSVGGGDLSDAGVVAINSQAARFSTAISSGVDVWANSGAGNPNYYNFLPPGAVATGVPLFGANGFVATPAGVAIGITDVDPTSMINGFPTHNSFASTDPVFTVFETRTLNGITETVSLGARNATITNGGFGAVQPGTDAIRVNIEDTAVVTTANIHDNKVNGYGVSGIHAVSNNTAQFQNLTIQNNTVTGSGDGISIERNDASLMNAIINNNTATGNSHSGLSIVGTGTDTPIVMVSLTDNTFTGNVGNGLFTRSADAAIVRITSNRDDFSQNTGDNIHGEAKGTSVTQLNLINVTSDSSGGNGLSLLTTESGEYYLSVTSPTDPLFTSAPRSSFSRNTLNGLLLSPRDMSLINVEIDDTNILTNTLNGLAFNRFGAGLFLANVTNSSISGNTVNGIQVTGLGSDPADPNQKLSGTPNTLTLLDVAVDRNGTAANFGNGLRADLFGDMAFVLDATRTTFNSNAGNGIRVETGPGAAFGYQFGGVRSVLDGVTIAGNTQNGIQIVSNISTTPNTDPESRTFMEINSNTANTLISNNGLNGILLQYPGGTHDLLILGDTNPAAPANTTIIRANAIDGLHVDTGVFATSLVTVDNVVFGGATAADGNGGDGIDFDVTSRFRVLDGATNTTWLFNTAGVGTLNVNNSTIRNNGAHGLNLLGQGFRSFGFGAFDGSAADEPFQNFDSDPFGQINANITASRITDNALNGVNIDLRGAMGGDHRNFAIPNSLVFDGNLIASNGQHGVFFESNAGQQIRGGNTHRRIQFNDPQPTNPPAPYNPSNVLANDWNTGDNTDISGGAFLSNYLNLRTDQATDLVFTNNRVQFNGTATVLGEGVYLRVGTDSYLSADIRGNTIVGNLGNDLKIESFVAYNRQTGTAIPVPPSVPANPGPDVVFLDDSAQLDLRLAGNTANSANIVSPLNNGGGLPGTFTPNGAVYPGELPKNNFGGNIQPRLTQLFQVDDGNNLGSNVFTTNGVVQNLSNSFFNASFHLRVAADPLFPNPAFPEDFFTDPGDPFLP